MARKKARKLASLNDLKPAPYNPRTIDIAAKHGLKKSTSEFGDLSGIVWNKRTGHLVAGHQRVDVLKEQGAVFETEPPRLILDGASFAIRVVDWDEDTEKAANLAANNPGIQGDFTAEAEAIAAEVEASLPDLYDGLRLEAIAGEPTTTTEPGASEGLGPDDTPGDGPPEMELAPFEHYDYVVILARDTMDWEFICEKLGIEKVNASPIAGKKKIGLGRAVDAKKLIELLRDK